MRYLILTCLIALFVGPCDCCQAQGGKITLVQSAAVEVESPQGSWIDNLTDLKKQQLAVNLGAVMPLLMDGTYRLDKSRSLINGAIKNAGVSVEVSDDLKTKDDLIEAWVAVFGVLVSTDLFTPVVQSHAVVESPPILIAPIEHTVIEQPVYEYRTRQRQVCDGGQCRMITETYRVRVK